jgi:hypothetical protein
VRVVYDAGVLIAADRDDRRTWSRHEAFLRRDVVPVTTAPVVAQASRSSRQANLRRFLHSCETVAFPPSAAHPVGALMAAAGTSDVVDAHLVLEAHASGATVVTSDPGGLAALAVHLPAPPQSSRRD